MQDSVLQRVNEILEKRYEGNVSKMSKAISVNTTTLAYQLSGKRSVSLDTIIAIAGVHSDISLKWLLLGTGAMVEPSTSATNIIQHTGSNSNNTSLQYNDTVAVQTLCESLREQIRTKDEQIRTLLDIISRCHGNV